jgi:hypothetical protein
MGGTLSRDVNRRYRYAMLDRSGKLIIGRPAPEQDW